MKKLLKFIIGIVLVLSLSGVVSALDLSPTDPAGNVEVTFTPTNTYLVTIPSTISIDASTLTGSADVKATVTVLLAGQDLQVTINEPIEIGMANYYLEGIDLDATSFTHPTWVFRGLSSGNTVLIPYKISMEGDDDVAAGDVVLTTDTTTTKTLTFTVNADDVIDSGSYHSLMSFSLSLVGGS